MKIQYLAVIFIIIIMPIVIVFSEYINNQMTIVKTEGIYDERLFDSTYDSIKAFQLNTVNSTYYSPQARVRAIEASVKTFYNSLVTSFQYDGNLSSTMKEYVPAVVFTMYDGYYIYSPFKNKLTGVENEVDEEYVDGKIIDGVKPFVSYTCRYNYDGKKYVITYSLDNYVYVDIFEGNKHLSKGGYLINGISKNGNNYVYDGITFTENTKEVLKENLENETYYYTILDGVKYYYYNSHTNNGQKSSSPNDNDYIFYMDEQREKHKQVMDRINNVEEFDKYYNRIFNNNAAYLYYKEAYEFTTWLISDGKKIDIDKDGELDQGQNLQGLATTNIVGAVKSGNIIKKDSEQYQFENYEFMDVGNIFEGNIEYSNSNFNRHRADVIRATITTNLAPAITGYSQYSKAIDVEFLMPKISETDWELLENNICIATFMQGMKVGDKTYNNYSVIPNNLNNEYVDENDIYILKRDGTYTRTNDNSVRDGTNILDKSAIGFEPGVYNMNFETKQDKDGKYYNPVVLNNTLYLQSYTNLGGDSQINSLERLDMYRYVQGCSNRLKQVYYTALGRERYGSFKYTINEI